MKNKNVLYKMLSIILLTSFICMLINCSITKQKSKIGIDLNDLPFKYALSYDCLTPMYWGSYNNIKEKRIQIEKQKELERKQKELEKQNLLSTENFWLKATDGSHLKYYEPYYLITDTTSDAWKFQQRNDVYENSQGFLVQYYKGKEWYCVALGNYFGNIGSRYIFTLENGNQIYVVKGDCKDDIDTDNDNYTSYNGHILEFMINPHTEWMYNYNVEYHGMFLEYDSFDGAIIKIEKVVK